MSCDDPSSNFDICLFGKLKVTIGQDETVHFRTRTVGWLFAFHVFNHDKTIRREDLLTAIWPDAQDPETARSTMRRQLAFVRKALGAQASRLSSPGKNTLLLDLAGSNVDVFAFEAAIKANDLHSAVELYTGELLPSCSGLWAITRREEYKQRFIDSLKKLAHISLDAGNTEQAISYLRRCYSEDRSQEDVALALMEAYNVTGALSNGIQVYRELRTELASVHGTIPVDKTTDKYRQLVTALSNQQRLSAGPQVQAGAPAGYVPKLLVRLIGRNWAVADVLNRLERNPLVTLTGPGGIGKSMLALEVAHQAWPDFPQGVWFVDLLNVRSPEHLIPEIASALELQSDDVANEKSLLRTLRTKSLLLLLDNCEHLIPGITALCRSIVQACPNVRLMATSRQPLRLRGEQNWRVPPLALPPLPPDPLYEAIDASGQSADLLRYEAVELFVERAEQSWQEFSLTPDNARVIARLCHRLEGLPLAVDLAATWVGAFSLEELEKRLVDRFSVLTQGDPSGPSHHKTLRLTVDWSYESLTPHQQLLWKALSLFSAEWSEYAVEGILPHPDAAQPLNFNLRQLVDHSVVVKTPDGNSHRYHMLETLREYGRIRMAETPELIPPLRTHHLQCMLALASNDSDNLTLLNKSNADFRDALEWAAQSGNVKSGMILATALWRLWNQRGDYEEGYLWLDTMLKAAPNSVDMAARMKAMSAAGNLAYRRGDNTSAKRWFQNYKELAFVTNNTRAMASAYGNLGNLATQENRLEEAQDNFERSVILFDQLNDARGSALSKSNLAIIACRRADFEAAYRYHKESIELFREHSDRLNLAIALANLTETRISAGEGPGAATTLEESLRICFDIGYMRTAAHCLCMYLNIAVSLTLFRESAILIGISEVWSERSSFVISPQSAERFNSDLAAIRSNLSEEVLHQSVRIGRALTDNQAVDHLVMLGERLQLHIVDAV